MLLSKILKDLYQEGNWVDEISWMKLSANPEMARQLPIGLLTSSDIQATTDGAIDELKFFQLGFIICIIVFESILL